MTEEKKEDKKITTEEAAKLIEVEKAENIAKCTEKITAVLKEFNCDIAVSFLITAQGNRPNVQIVSK